MVTGEGRWNPSCVHVSNVTARFFHPVAILFAAPAVQIPFAADAGLRSMLSMGWWGGALPNETMAVGSNVSSPPFCARRANTSDRMLVRCRPSFRPRPGTGSRYLLQVIPGVSLWGRARSGSTRELLHQLIHAVAPPADVAFARGFGGQARLMELHARLLTFLVRAHDHPSALLEPAKRTGADAHASWAQVVC